MSGVWDYLPESQDGKSDHRSTRRAMGAQERRRWSSFVRQDLIAETISLLRVPDTYGVAIFGPNGVGKSTLSKSVESTVQDNIHIVRLYGTGLETSVSFGVWGLHIARLENVATESPISIIQGIAELVQADANGREIIVMLDDVGKIDTSSVAVLMHLVFSRVAKVMVMARVEDELPEDLVWLLKDNTLSHLTLKNFTKAEVHSLLSKGLGNSVAASVVDFLHSSSGGNPLVLHTLVYEEIRRGHIKQQNSIWVLNKQLPATPSVLLEELVEARLARESPEVRRGIEKMALIQRAPLPIVLNVLGPTVVAEMEERQYLFISEKDRSYTSLAESYIGATVRSMMSREVKARIFKEIEAVSSVEPGSLSDQELLVFAAWANDAGMPLEPEVALAAAKAAILYFDPLLALKCTASIVRNTVLRPQAAIVRSSAYSILADYPKAVSELEVVEVIAESSVGAADYASWVIALCGALLWVDGGAEQVPELLGAARLRLGTMATDASSREQAEKLLDLAMFEYQVHTGLFAEAASGLESGYKNSVEIDYRLNCGSLLVMVWAVTGRELDAIALANDIDKETRSAGLSLRQPDLYRQGLVLALTWTGQWRESATAMNEYLAHMRRSSEFHGGVVELGLGIAYTYAGKGMEAADILVVAIAQLEIRDRYNSVQLAYAALAFAFAQVEDTAEAERYLAKAGQLHPSTTWINSAMTRFFTLMAQRWMDNPSAVDELINSAAEDESAGRYTMASMSLFGATLDGQEKHIRQLASLAAKRQGPMADLTIALANACLEKDAGQALVAARMAEHLDLAAVESRCAVTALDFAHLAGQQRLAREAQTRIDRLLKSIPAFPLVPQNEGEKLTQRERQVAKLAGRGLGNRAIAELMGVSIRTIEGHLYQVFSKLGISSRSELI